MGDKTPPGDPGMWKEILGKSILLPLVHKTGLMEELRGKVRWACVKFWVQFPASRKAGKEAREKGRRVNCPWKGMHAVGKIDRQPQGSGLWLSCVSRPKQNHTCMGKASEWQRERQDMCSTVPGRQGKQFCLDLCINFTLEIKHKGAFSISKSSTSSNYG